MGMLSNYVAHNCSVSGECSRFERYIFWNVLMVAITIHWVDKNFVLHEGLLSFQEMKGSHTGECLADAVYRVLDRFSVCDKLMCITSDNASNNDRMYKSLATILLIEKEIEWDSKAMHIRCMNHIINLSVQAFLKDLKVLQVKKRNFLDLEDNYVDDDDEGTDHSSEEDDEGVGEEQTALFTATLSKLRLIAKVLSICSALFHRVSLVVHSLCATCENANS